MQTEGRIRTSYLDWVSLLLVIVGALNWGLIGIGHFVDSAANWNLVNIIFDGFQNVEAAIYLLVGLAALWELYFAYQLYTARQQPRQTRRETAED